MTTICIPLHPRGGKFGSNLELRFALRSLARHFQGDFRVVLVTEKPPEWVDGVDVLVAKGGLKTAIKSAGIAYPDGFLWWYDDCVILQDTDAARLKITPACRGWRGGKTSWGKMLEQVRQRLVAEGIEARDYSRPHGPYWFDRSMIDEGFGDWPGMAGKFPWESWILSKRQWPWRSGIVKQYYGDFRGAPGEWAELLNYNDKGNTAELREFLWERFPDPCRFEAAETAIEVHPDNSPVCGIVLDLPSRPRFGAALIEALDARGIKCLPFAATDGHLGHQSVAINLRAFKKRFGRGPLHGEVGCYDSHVRIAREIVRGTIPPLESGSEWSLVLEDDAEAIGSMRPAILRTAAAAADGRFDIVLLHSGRKCHRRNAPLGIGPVKGREFGTFAYLIHKTAAAKVGSWIMRHPIDLAFLSARNLRIGVLWGADCFSHREATKDNDAIRWERIGKNGNTTPRKVIHQVWVQGECGLPDEFKKNRELWAREMPDYKMILWDEISAANQWPEFKKYSHRCAHHATRADLILARAIRDFGGLAIGTDSTPQNATKLRAILDTLDNFVVITPGRHELSNGLQWCATKGHPFWKKVCEHQIRGDGAHLGRQSVSSATGPKCYMDVFNSGKWRLFVLSAPLAFTRDWKNEWENPDGLIDPGFAASWALRPLPDPRKPAIVGA